ncbi:hypothetical protein D3C84_510270 [compost metagenome]
MQVLEAEALGQFAGHRRTAGQPHGQRRLAHGVAVASAVQRPAEDEVGQRLLLAHGRVGEDLGGGLIGAAIEAQAGGDVADGAHRLHVQVGLVQRAGEQQARPAQVQALAVGAVAAVLQHQLAATCEVVAHLEVALEIRRQAEAGELQAVLAHFDVHIHGDLQRLLLGVLLAYEAGIRRHLDRLGRQFADLDPAAGHQHLAGHRQALAGQADAQVRFHFQVGVGFHHQGQARAAQGQVEVQPLGPGQAAGKAALPLVATAPLAAQFHALAGDARVEAQRFEAHRQLTAADAALGEAQVAQHIGRKQRAAQAARALQAALQLFHLGHEGP